MPEWKIFLLIFTSAKCLRLTEKSPTEQTGNWKVLSKNEILQSRRCGSLENASIHKIHLNQVQRLSLCNISGTSPLELAGEGSLMSLCPNRMIYCHNNGDLRTFISSITLERLHFSAAQSHKRDSSAADTIGQGVDGQTYSWEYVTI